MKRSKEHITLIEKYFNLELNDTELEELQELLKKNEGFAKTFEAYESARNISDEQFESEEDRQRKEEWRNALDDNKRQEKKNRFLWLRWAAAAIALLVFLVWFSENRKAQNYEQLAEESWNLDLGLSAYAGLRDESLDSNKLTLQKIAALYDNGEFHKALELIKTTDVLTSKGDLIFLRALTEKKLGNTASAIQYLEGLIEQKPLANWYLALIYLEDGQKAEAMAYLEVLANADTPYAQAADNLLKKLR